MLMFQSHFKIAWNDYFTATGQNNISSQTFSLRQTPSNTCVYVSNCLFRFITSSGNGGALSCTSVTYFLVESTSFISCSTSDQYGGAVYFSNGGQCALHEVCGYDCCSTYTSRSDGQFVHTAVNNVISSKNYVNYTSITRCMNQISYSHYVLDLRNGKIYCPSVNMSMNKCPHASGIFCHPFTDSNSYTSSVTYSSFADNLATISICIYFYRTGANYEVKSCNVIRNTHGSLGSHGLFYTYDNVMIEDSCILENKATYIFCQQNSAYRFTISNCTIDSTSNNGYLSIRNTFTKSFIHALNHMSTKNCHSEYDAVGTLTPIIHSPSPSKKQIRLCTCGNSFYQSELTFLVSIIRVFLFNFIHLNAYSYPLC
jgi:hypothetical protein